MIITGATGQLGQALMAQFPSATGCSRNGPPEHQKLDLQDTASINPVLDKLSPAIILHAAAMTDVDGCERDPALAHRINAEASQEIASWAHANGAKMVHVSTDYVFDGQTGNYDEAAAPSPVNAYGASKLAGEQAVLATCTDALVVRPSVVFGPFKQDFVSWLIEKIGSKAEFNLVTDQWVTPSYAPDIAAAIEALLEAGQSGIFHVAGPARLSRWQMAESIAAQLDLPLGCGSTTRAEIPWLATRPRDTSLATAKLQQFYQPQTFEASVQQLLKVRS